MKKIMIAIVAVAITAVANAAAFSWTSSGLASTKNIYASDGSTLLYVADSASMLYLFDAGVVSQDNLLNGLRNGDSIGSFASVASQSLASNSRVTTQAVSYGEGGNFYDFYMAIVSGDEVFVGASVNVGAQASDVANIAINGLATATKKSFADSSDTFAANGAGWYNTAAIPEPTSGLLLLLGMAGLALKRKQA